MRKESIIWYHEQGVSQQTLEMIDEVVPSWDVLDVADFPSLNGKERALLRQKASTDEVLSYIHDLHSRGIRVYLRNEDDFPAPLKDIPDSPFLIYQKGEYSVEDHLAIGVVGARKCTHYGAWACEKFVRELAPYNVTIVSGLALGIDRIAHETAINHHTRTIAVVGNGLDKVYPKSHRGLYPKVIEHGCIFSEFPTWAEPLPHHFPFRNRLIAGLSLGVILVEAKKKSGTMSTAEHTLKQGKDVFCIPGNLNSVYSEGCNQLIQEGAKMLMTVDDILEEIAVQPLGSQLDFFEESDSPVLQALKEGPLPVDALVDNMGWPVHEIQMELTKLELLGQISIEGGLVYRKR